MAAENNEGGNVPTHDEHAERHPHDGGSHGIDIPQVFRSKIEGIGPKAMHESAVDRTEKNKPE